MSANEHIETNRRIEREERERNDRGGGTVWPGSGTGRLGAAALSAHAGDSVPVVDSKAGEAGSGADYMREDTQPGLKLVGDPADDTAEGNASLEFTSDGGSPETRDGLQVRIDDATYPTLEVTANGLAVKFDADDFQATDEGLALVGELGTTIPAGALMMWGGGAAPGGWLLCDGSAVSRTTCADLFSAIGTTYGVGDGSTTFNLPDFTNKFARGNTPGTGGGADTHDAAVTGDTAQSQANIGDHGAQATTTHTGHEHPWTTDAPNSGFTKDGNYVVDTGGSHDHNTPILQHTPYGHQHSAGSLVCDGQSNVPAYTGVKFIIKT